MISACVSVECVQQGTPSARSKGNRKMAPSLVGRPDIFCEFKSRTNGSVVMKEQKTLIIKRIFNAPPATVWKAWTEEKYIKQWWGPDRFTCPSAKIDLREGG